MQQKVQPINGDTSPYGGGGGQLDDIEKLMMKYDQDKSGTFDFAEVKKIISEFQQEKDKAKSLKKRLCWAQVGILVVCGMMVSSSFVLYRSLSFSFVLFRSLLFTIVILFWISWIGSFGSFGSFEVSSSRPKRLTEFVMLLLLSSD